MHLVTVHADRTHHHQDVVRKHYTNDSVRQVHIRSVPRGLAKAHCILDQTTNS